MVAVNCAQLNTAFFRNARNGILQGNVATGVLDFGFEIQFETTAIALSAPFAAMPGVNPQSAPAALKEISHIARICHKFQIGRRVLDVRSLLKKPHAARDGKGNLLTREFQLQFQRVKKCGAIQHRNMVQAHPLVAQFQCPLPR